MTLSQVLRASRVRSTAGGLALPGLASVLWAGACLSGSPTLQPGTRATLFERDAPLGTEHIEVQLVRVTDAVGRRPLLLYATGDGGWRSADSGLFQHLAGWGYPVAAFSARHYLGHLGYEATTPAQVAEDYGHLIVFAKKALELPSETPTVLVGFSRGSGLAVVAAGQHRLQPLLGGVLAVALTDEEEYVRDYRRRTGRDPRDASVRELATLRPYDLLPALGLPVAVIQSTEDSYLPAAQARQLFGPDDALRRFYSIDSGGHTFAGARDALYEQARLALEWIVACPPRARPAQARPTR